MKRNLLILVLGIGFLIVMTWVGTILVDILPHRPSAQVQTALAGPYQLTLQVDPNPPPITQPATLLVQVMRQNAPVTNAHVTVESTMETMDMGTDSSEAQSQSNGIYRVPVQFSMSGPFQVRVLVAVPGAKTESATFEVTAQ
jgi:hypothetical protein